MFYFGWNRVIDKSLGRFTGNYCGLCGKSTNYKLMLKRTFFTFLFIPLISYLSEYYCKCTNCMVTKQLDKDKANDIMEMYLPSSKIKLMIGNFFRFAFIALVVGGFLSLILLAN